MKKIFVFLILLISTIVCISAERPRWLSQPINVYIPEYGNMSILMKQAFLTWQNQSKNVIRFKFVSGPSNADIEVEFVDFVSGCGDTNNAVGCTETTTKGGEYRKAYITIGTKEYVRSYSGGYSRKIVTRSKNHIYGVMLHEAGHAIGLGHSDSPGSIMYPYDLDDLQYLTKNDLQLLYNKYH